MSEPTIDLTNRYHTSEYMRGGPDAWRISRNATPYRAIPVHHTAGWYGETLHADATEAQEIAQIDSMARDHRSRFGIGPAYVWVIFPSGRGYAVGKVGTHRAHTKGRNPETGERWNVEGCAVVFFGNFETERPTPEALATFDQIVAEIRGWPFTVPAAPIHPHGLIPTVNSQGVPFPQGTSCPGRHLLAQLRAEPEPEPPPQIDVEAANAALDKIEEETAELRSLIGGAA